MTEAIIFDLDGTLVDSCGVCITILQEMLYDRGMDQVGIDHAYARSFMSRGGEDMVANLLGPAARHPALDLREFRDRYNDVITPPTALYEGVAEGLERLHDSGVTLAICSNKPQNLCEKSLADTGIDRFFPVVVGGAPERKAKPAPDLLDLTLDRLQLRATDCLYVGDSELDHQVAMQADMRFFFVTYGYAEPGWLPEKAPLFDHFAPLARELAQIRAYAIT